MRKAFTLVELLIVLAIVVLLALLFVPIRAVAPGNYYNVKTNAIYRCVKTYTIQNAYGTSVKRVDLQKIGSTQVETFEVENSWFSGVDNSATIFAQFEAGKTYSVDSVGFREESIAITVFPQIVNVNLIQNPSKPELDL